MSEEQWRPKDSNKISLKQHFESNVDHPSYYNKGKIEVIDFIEDQHLGFHLGNVVKYICREGKVKSLEERIEDLEKALWYLQRYIESYKKEQKGQDNVISVCKDSEINRVEEGYTE